MIGIIGAMDIEVGLLRDSLERAGSRKVGALEFHEGLLEGREAVLLKCGVGKVNAAVGCAAMIQIFKPDFVVNTGSAGGIGAGLSFGDVVISTGLLYHDADVGAFGYAPGQIPGMPAVFQASDGLVAAAAIAFAELKAEKILPEELNCRPGIVASGDVFMSRAEDIARLRRLFPDVAAVEMEGAAIAHCCALFSVPALVVRALSDIAGEESPVTFEEFLPAASKNSAEIVRRIAKNS